MSDQNQFLLHTAPDGAVKVEVFFKDETVWLTQKALTEDSVCANFAHTATDGKTYRTNYYNLDAIIAVGY